jgi:hypothetical protein
MTKSLTMTVTPAPPSLGFSKPQSLRRKCDPQCPRRSQHVLVCWTPSPLPASPPCSIGPCLLALPSQASPHLSTRCGPPDICSVCIHKHDQLILCKRHRQLLALCSTHVPHDYCAHLLAPGPHIFPNHHQRPLEAIVIHGCCCSCSGGLERMVETAQRWCADCMPVEQKCVAYVHDKHVSCCGKGGQPHDLLHEEVAQDGTS